MVEQIEHLQQVVGDQRQEGIELELAALGGERDRQIIGHDLVGDLVDGLGQDGIDLAWHDRRA